MFDGPYVELHLALGKNEVGEPIVGIMGSRTTPGESGEEVIELTADETLVLVARAIRVLVINDTSKVPALAARTLEQVFAERILSGENPEPPKSPIVLARAGSIPPINTN